MPDDSTGLRSVSATPLELLRTPPPRERADAARNRVAVLQAAARLFAEHGWAAVSMDQVAAGAGVAKGTVFRRFGDKAGLAVALLDTRERELQEVDTARAAAARSRGRRRGQAQRLHRR